MARPKPAPLLPGTLPRIDGEPPRLVTSLNVRFEDKRVFDALQTWWSLRSPQPLKRWDAFSVLLAAALENPDVEVPQEVRRR